MDIPSLPWKPDGPNKTTEKIRNKRIKSKKSGPGINDREGNDPRRGTTNPKHMSVSQKQAFLAKLGYAIDVDGIWGPQSQMAWKAYSKKIPAKYWNANAPRSNSFVAKGGGGKGGGGGGGGRGGGGNEDTSDTSETASFVPGTLAPWDANAWATATTNAAYAGPIAELRRARLMEQAQGKQAQFDIRSWFDQVMSTARSGQQANKQSIASGLENFDSAAAGLAAAFGGGANIAAGEMGSAALTGHAGLQGLGQVQSAFDERMRGILDLQGKDALLRESRDRQNRLFEMSGKLTDLLGERGSALQKNRLDAQNIGLQRESQFLQNEAARQNMHLAQQMLPHQVALAQAQTQGALASTKQAALDYETTQAQFEAWQEQQTGGGFSQLDPGERSDLADRLYKAVVGADGKPIVGRNKAFGIVGNLLKAANLTGPEANEFRQQIMRWIFPGIKFGPKGNPSTR